MRPDADGQHLRVLRTDVVGSGSDRGHAGIAGQVLQVDLHPTICELLQEPAGNRIRIHDDIPHGFVPVFRDGPCIPLDQLERPVEDGLLHRVACRYAVGMELEQLEIRIGLVRVEHIACRNPHLLSPEQLVSRRPGDLRTLQLVQGPDGQDHVRGVHGGHDLACLLVGAVGDDIVVPPLGAVPLDGFHDSRSFSLLAGDPLAVVVLGNPEGGLLPVDGEHRDPDVVLGGDVLRLPQSRRLQKRKDPGEGLLRRYVPDPCLRGVLRTALQLEHRASPIDISPGDGSSPPSVSDGIQLRILPAGPGPVYPAVRTCSGGESPFHQIPGNVAA